MQNKRKFKICLTMAGAVSAGAFTAGAVDYLLETLDLWEKAKTTNRSLGEDHPQYDHTVPMHDVEIDVISGASAGGITGALTLLNLVDSAYSPVNKDNRTGANNRFYQSWVNMADDDTANTFDKMLATDDLQKNKKGERPEALLNAEAIDRIAEVALHLGKTRAYPAYISKSLDLILTTTNLRGINFQIDFGGVRKTGPVITNHGGFFRYKLANEQFSEGIPPGDNLYYVLNLERERDMRYLKEATLSTAAFPIGLKSRQVAISQTYIDRYPKYLFGQKTGIVPLVKENTVYKFNSIDGGLINNEPFAIGLKILKEKSPVAVMNNQYAVIMIDPFPNQDSDVEEADARPDIVSVAKGMFKALRNQAMFNQDGILDAVEGADHTKFMIEPVRKAKVGQVVTRVKSHLAAAPFSGFAGFVDRSFREHDYQLGRLNCQSFLRYYFALPEDELEPKLGDFPHARAIDRFGFHERQFDYSSPRLMPIIPDMRLLKARINVVDRQVYGADALLDYPEFPQLADGFFQQRYGKAIKRRVEMLLNGILPNFWFKIANRLFIRRRAAKAIEDMILKALQDNHLIQK